MTVSEPRGGTSKNHLDCIVIKIYAHKNKLLCVNLNIPCQIQTQKIMYLLVIC